MQAEIVAGREIRQGNRNRWMLVAAAAVTVTALGIHGYRFMGATQQATQQAAPAQAVAAVAVKTAPAVQGDISAALGYSGDVKSVSQVSVLPKGAGRIEKLTVDVGSRVKRGDVIAELDSASLQAQLSQAQAGLASAQAKYASLQSGSRQEQIAQAQLALDSANARLDSVTKGSRPEQIQTAQAQVDSAKANVRAAQARVDTVKLGPTETQWGQAMAAVDTAQANLKAAQERLADVKAGPKAADVAAAVAAVQVAQTNFLAKQDALEAAKNGTPQSTWAVVGSSMSEAYAALAAAQAQYNAAVSALDLLKSKPLPADLQAAQSSFDAARASLDAATATVDEMKRGPKKEDIQAAESAVAAAQGQQAAAEANLRLLQAGPTDEDVRQAQNAVASAEQQLSLVQNPYTAHDLDLAKAAVMQAQATVEQAQIGLGEASIVSPVDGIIAERYQSEGQLVGPSTPLVSIVSGEVELALGVEESQIGQIAEGQKAEITVAAFPGVVFPAKVAMIAPSADPKSRTFQVKVIPVSGDGKLKAGMFAQVRIVTAEKQGALLIPKEAIVTKGGQSSVFVASGDTAQQRQVKTGLSNATSVEVTSGLSAGEEVVVAGGSDLRDGDRVKKS